MRICVAFLLVLLFLSCVPVQAEINPSVDTKPFFCRYTITDWTPLCPTMGAGGAGSGSTFINSENSTYYYNTTANETIIYGNTTSFFNTTIGNNLTTFSNYTYWYITNITYSEMNQTPGPQGPQGIQGEIGPEGPMNQTPNMTAGPPGSMNMTPNMTAGPQGIQGPAGEKGDTGAQGPAGPAGADGAANMTAGPQGIQGIQGIEGPMNQTPNMTAGPTGATGAAGPAGLDANVSSMYPVTSVYGSTSTTNPNTLLGAGTWSPVYNISGAITLLKLNPPMTSNSAPSGNTTAANTEYSSTYAAWKGMDGSTSTQWASSNGGNTGPWWWLWHPPYSKVITNYTVYSRSDDVSTVMRNWTLRGSTDGSTWTTIDTQIEQVWGAVSTPKYYSVASPGNYSYYNFSITRCSFTGTNNCGFGEVEFNNITSITKSVYYWERTA